MIHEAVAKLMLHKVPKEKDVLNLRIRHGSMQHSSAVPFPRSELMFIFLHLLFLVMESLPMEDLEFISDFSQTWKFQACYCHCTSSVILGNGFVYSCNLEK